MSAITNQQPSNKIELVVPVKLRFEGLYRLAQRIAIIASVLFFTIYGGVILGLLEWGFTSYTGGAVGTIVGLITGIFLSIKAKLPSNIEKYRASVFEKLRVITSNLDCLKISEQLRDFFHYPFTGFSEYYHHHLLHTQLAIFGDHIDRTREDAVKTWKDFLQHLHRTPLVTPDLEKFLFNATFLLRRFEGEKVNYNIKQVNTWTEPLDNEALEQIREIGRMGFGKTYATAPNQILAKLKSHSGKIFAAREAKTGKIFAYGWYFIENGVVKIPEIARLPEIPKTQVGVSILMEILRKQKKNQPVEIILRKNNPYRHKLESYGFAPTKEIPNYYGKPKPENGIVVSLDWEKYESWSQSN